MKKSEKLREVAEVIAALDLKFPFSEIVDHLSEELSALHELPLPVVYKVPTHQGLPLPSASRIFAPVWLVRQFVSESIVWPALPIGANAGTNSLQNVEKPTDWIGNCRRWRCCLCCMSRCLPWTVCWEHSVCILCLRGGIVPASKTRTVMTRCLTS